jgi:DNA polymerase III subunit delta
MKYEELLNELKKGVVRPVYVFSGEESYFKEEAVSKLKEIIFKDKNEATNYEVIDAGEIKDKDISSLINRFNLVSFFGQTELIAVKNADKICNSKEIKEYVLSPNPRACLLLLVAKSQRSLSKYEVIFYHPYASKITNWIRQKTVNNGKEISAQALSVLQELAGNDLWHISTELDKLVSYVGARKRIEVSDVLDVVPQKSSLTIWNLLDSIAQKDKAEALAALKTLLDNEEFPGSIINMMGRQFRLLLQVRELCGAGNSSEKITAVLGYKDPRYAVKLAEQGKSFSDAKLRNNLKYLIRADLDIKTSKLPASVILEILVSRLCS